METGPRSEQACRRGIRAEGGPGGDGRGRTSTGSAEAVTAYDGQIDNWFRFQPEVVDVVAVGGARDQGCMMARVLRLHGHEYTEEGAVAAESEALCRRAR